MLKELFESVLGKVEDGTIFLPLLPTVIKLRAIKAIMKKRYFGLILFVFCIAVGNKNIDNPFKVV